MRIVSRTYAKAEAELIDLANYLNHLGKYRRRSEVLDALTDLYAGKRAVVAGHTIYEIEQEAAQAAS